MDSIQQNDLDTTQQILQAVALDALRDPYLVEEVVENDQCMLRQHNLIRRLSLERLKTLGEDDE